MRAIRRLLAAAVLLAAPAALSGVTGAAFADDAPPPSGMDAGPSPGADGAVPESDEPEGPVPFLEGVAKAIDKGVVWLKKKQLPDGSWGPITADSFYDPKAKGDPYQRPAGSTALALYALL